MRVYWLCTCGFCTQKGRDAYLHRGRLIGIHVISPLTKRELKAKGVTPEHIHRKSNKTGSFLIDNYQR